MSDAPRTVGHRKYRVGNLQGSFSMSSSQPNSTLYINNLNDKVTKEELCSQLYALFTTYGKVVDIVASKSKKMRGQAFLVFADQAGATSAMRACEGMLFYDKPMVRSAAISFSFRVWNSLFLAYFLCKVQVVCNTTERRPQLCSAKCSKCKSPCRANVKATARGPGKGGCGETSQA